MPDGTSGPGTEGPRRSAAEQGIADQLQGDAPGGGAQVDKSIAQRAVREYLRSTYPQEGAGEPDAKDVAQTQQAFQEAKQAYINGNPESMLDLLVPTQTDAATDAAMFALENMVKKNDFTEPVRQEIIKKWVDSGTPLEAAIFFIENVVQDDAIKAEMSIEVQAKLKPMSVQERQALYDQKVAEADEAMKYVPEEQKEHYRGKMEKLKNKLGDFFSADTTSGEAVRVGGKIAWYIIWIAFVALVFEMNMISKIPLSGGAKR